MLRPYQSADTKKILQAFIDGHQGVCYQLSTGGGKTRIFSHISSLANGTVWILVNREELLKSAYHALKNLGLNPTVLHPKFKNFDPQAKYTVAMVQTLKKRDISLGHVSLVIIDECHLTDFDSVLPRFTNAKRLGVSATPKRKGRVQQLSNFYSKLICGPSIKWLISNNYLVNCNAYTYNVVDLSKVPELKGEYDYEMMYGEFDKNIVYSGVVDNWLRIAKGKKTIVFCCNIAHAKSMAEQFNFRGVRAKFVVSLSDGQESRSEIIEQWRAGEFDILVNASIFTTGFDERSIGCVILARATMSENLYLQMIGRGSRIFKDKADFTLLDFGENVQRHGEYNQARVYSLVHSVRLTKGAPVMKECPQCNSYLIGSARSCNFCGYNFPLSKKEIVEVELAPYVSLNIGNIDVTNPEQLDRIMRAKKKTPSWAARQIFVTNRENARNLIKNFANFKGYKNYWVELTYKTLGI